MIHFDLNRLSSLYQFKKETIQLCLQFIKEVVKSSSHAKSRTLSQKLKNIESDLYDIFCRWNFNSIQNQTFDLDTFLPTGSFILLVDIEYYLKRFHIQLSDSLISFPFDTFESIREQAKMSKPCKDNPTSCSEFQQKRLCSIYQGQHIEQDIHKLLSRYYYLGGLNNSLSIPPHVLSHFKSHELFGTPFNTSSDQYCSPFVDEAIFGSSGSFFEFTNYQDDTIYFANPPFDDTFCSKVSSKLLSDLSQQLFSLIVIIPVWGQQQQEEHNLKNYGLPFLAYDTLKNSPYFIKEAFLDKDQFPFFNYFYQKYVFISNTHIINLGKQVDIEFIMNHWKSKSK